MKRHNSAGSLKRRDFLALATGGAASFVVGLPGWATLTAAGQDSPMQGMAAAGYGSISAENFVAARKRAAELVGKMTLEEKISQFGNDCPAIPRLGIKKFNYYASEALHGLIHNGPITSFPLPLAMGCSWNRALIEEVFTAVSDEIWAWHKKDGQGLAMFSPPTVNMGTRDPRWGRIGENYSEDPYLVGEMAIGTIRGMQGNDVKYLKTIACAKHFTANDTENDRETTSATVDSRSYWEYYSRGFEACVRRGHVFTVMSSYNEMNGIPTTANPLLLTDLLRKRWGFRGYVVSDCNAVGDVATTHHFVPNEAEAAALAVNAGTDINCGHTMPKHLGEAVDQMLVSEETLERSLIRSFTGRVLLGEFDAPAEIPYNSIPESCLESIDHRNLAREAARQSIVLFKNDGGLLPLDKSRLKKIAVIGPMADVARLGDYSGHPTSRVSPLRGLQDYLGIPAEPGYSMRASDLAKNSGTQHLKPGAEGGEYLAYAVNDGWASFPKMRFDGATEFHARVAADKGAGGTLEVHIDSLTGPTVATLNIPVTGDWLNWKNLSVPLVTTTGEHEVYLHFTGSADRLFNLESFHLTPAKPFGQNPNVTLRVSFALGCTETGAKDPAQFAEAVDAAREADVALLFVGADGLVSTEGRDRKDIKLPGIQDELIREVQAANSRTIVVICSQCPVAVDWAQEHVPAIIGGHFLGQEQGRALAEVLFGDYNPGGKLNTTWFRSVQDLPDFHDYNVRKGRTYLYFKGTPLYPFGHGLSYTKFEYGGVHLNTQTLKPGDVVKAEIDISNSGSRAGDEIVQLYVRFPETKVERPQKQLVNFERVHLKPGETRTVRLEVPYDHQALCYWDEAKYDFIVEPGPMEIQAGASSADIRVKAMVQVSA
jgi:beta-glucosidase